MTNLMEPAAGGDKIILIRLDRDGSADMSIQPLQLDVTEHGLIHSTIF